jgi:hypothetical protein
MTIKSQVPRRPEDPRARVTLVETVFDLHLGRRWLDLVKLRLQPIQIFWGCDNAASGGSVTIGNGATCITVTRAA